MLSYFIYNSIINHFLLIKSYLEIIFIEKFHSNNNQKNMYNIELIFREIIIFFIFSITAFYIDIEFPDICTHNYPANTKEEIRRRGQKEKGMIIILSILTSTILAAITVFIITIQNDNPLNMLINMSSLTTGILGGIYLSIPIIENVTYGDRLIQNPLSKRLLRQKRNALFKLTGSCLILWSLGIQILYYFQIL